jgi:hypothetical protein
MKPISRRLRAEFVASALVGLLVPAVANKGADARTAAPPGTATSLQPVAGLPHRTMRSGD